MQSTAYYLTALQIYSGTAKKGKDVVNFQKFQKNLNCLSFLTLQPCSPELSLQQTQTPRKMLPFECSETFQNFTEKGL